MNNNFRQNPEYFFFKTKRENFRNQNLLSKLDTLSMKLIGEEILEEIDNLKNPKNKLFGKLFTKFNLEMSKNNASINKNFENNDPLNNDIAVNYESLTITDRIKMIIQGNVKEYMPKTFKIIVKENKND